MWQDFGSGVVVGGAGCRGGFCEKTPCQSEPVPASSKTDPLLAKTEPISIVGGTSVVTFKKAQKIQQL